MSATPLVSVYLPTRDRVDMVEAAIVSVLRQDYPHFELLIVDDASTDGTPEVLQRFAARDRRIRLFRQEAPRGAPAARNLGVREARGVFVTGLDDDDEMLPNRLGSLVAAYRDRYAFVCTGHWVNSGDWRKPFGNRRRIITLGDLLHGNCVGNQVLTRRDRFITVGGFDESLRAWQDYDLWTRMVERYGPALRLAEPTYLFWRGGGVAGISASANALVGARQYYDKFAMLMGPAHRRSQRLILTITRRDRLTLIDLLRCWTPATGGQALRYWLKSNLPFSRQLAEYRWRQSR